MRSPLLLLAAFFALGIWAGAYAQGRVVASPTTAGLALALTAVMCLAGLVALRLGKIWAGTIIVLAGFIAAGAVAEMLFPVRFGPQAISRIEERGVNASRPVLVEGRLATAPVREPYGKEVDLDASALEQDGEKWPVNGRVRLWVKSGFASSDAAPLDLEVGDWVRASAELRRPRVYQNPGAFDYRGWLESIQDISWLGNVRGERKLEKIPGPDLGWLDRTILRMRRGGLAAIDRMFPPWGAEARDGAVLKAVLFGDRSSLDSETVENFRKSGLYHLLVVAGLHVGLLAMLATLLFRILRLGETWRSSLVLALIAAYALVVEQRAPTLRATVMIAAYLVGKILYRERSLLNAVGLAALVLLFVRPAWLFEAGFDLSFAAALLIAGLAVPILSKTTEPYRLGLYRLKEINRDMGLPPKVTQFRLDLRSLAAFIEKRFAFFGRHPQRASTAVVAPVRMAVWVAEMLLFSTILQCGLMLPMVLVFHRITFAGVALNALSVPLMVLVLAVALPSVALVAILPSLAPGPAAVLGIILRALFALTGLPSLPPWLSYRLPGPPLWVALGFALSLVVAAWAWARHTKLFAAASASFVVFLALVCLHPFAPKLPGGVMEVTALDCGEGEAVFMVFPDRATALINTCGVGERSVRGISGSRWNAGEEIVSPFLWSRGIERLDVLALTHSPGEQRASAEALARNFKIGEVWLDTTGRSPAAYALLDDIKHAGARVREFEGGERMALGGASFHVLWPPARRENETLPSDGENLDSLVLQISDQEANILLAGHLDAKAARALVASGEPVASRLLQIYPRALAESSEDDFLHAVSPQVIWTSGVRSRGRPEALRAPEFRRPRFFRTDVDGAIQMTVNADRLALRVYRTSTGWGTGAGTGWLLTSPASSVP